MARSSLTSELHSDALSITKTNNLISQKLSSTPCKSNQLPTAVSVYNRINEVKTENKESETCQNSNIQRLFPTISQSSALKKPYESMLDNLANDPKIQKEIVLGERIGFYSVCEEIGSGNFSKVNLGIHCLTNEKVALKIMDKSKMNETEQNLLMHEIKTMEQLHHPNIIRLFEHSKNIIHRDIKAENVLISAPDWIKLADFGFACQVNPDDMLTTFCGSPAYAAPELFKNGRYCGKSADVWAVGVLLYFMLVGRTPFRGETISNLKECILRGVYPLPNYLSGSAQRVISQMLIIDPKKRSTIDEIKSCNFLKNCQFTESYIQCGIMPDEKELIDNPLALSVRNKLRFYGIDEAIIQDGASKGIRSAAIGTYRIVLHQAQQDYHQQERNQFRNDHVMVKRGKSSLALISDSRTCSLL